MKVYCWIACALVPFLAFAQEATPKAALGQGKGTLKPYKGPELPKSASIYDNSDILVFGDSHTVVPKGGVIYVPESLKSRVVKARPEGNRFQRWPEFYLKNIGWLTVEPMTYQQAIGKSPLPEAKWKALATKERVIVATIQGNPVNYQGARPMEAAQPAEKPVEEAPKAVPQAPAVQVPQAPPGFPGKNR